MVVLNNKRKVIVGKVKDKIGGLKRANGFLFWFFLPSLFLFVLFTHRADAENSGKDVFLKYKCNKCHAVKVQNIEPIVKAEKEEGEEEEGEKEKGKKKIVDLSGVGLKRDAGWIESWLLKKEKNEEGKKHKPKWKGTPDEMKTLVGWLSEQKTKLNEEEVKKWIEEIMKKAK